MGDGLEQTRAKQVDVCDLPDQITPICFTLINHAEVMVFHGGIQINTTHCHFCSDVQGQVAGRTYGFWLESN